MSEWLVAKHEWVESEGGTEESEGMRVSGTGMHSALFSFWFPPRSWWFCFVGFRVFAVCFPPVDSAQKREVP